MLRDFILFSVFSSHSTHINFIIIYFGILCVFTIYILFSLMCGNNIFLDLSKIARLSAEMGVVQVPPTCYWEIQIDWRAALGSYIEDYLCFLEIWFVTDMNCRLSQFHFLFCWCRDGCYGIATLILDSLYIGFLFIVNKSSASTKGGAIKLHSFSSFLTEWDFILMLSLSQKF